MNVTSFILDSSNNGANGDNDKNSDKTTTIVATVVSVVVFLGFVMLGTFFYWKRYNTGKSKKETDNVGILQLKDSGEC